MKKYKIPVFAQSFTIVEAATLEDAINDVNSGNPDIPGIDNDKVLSWEIDQWEPFEVDDCRIKDDYDNDLTIDTVFDHSKY